MRTVDPAPLCGLALALGSVAASLLLEGTPPNAAALAPRLLRERLTAMLPPGTAAA